MDVTCLLIKSYSTDYGTSCVYKSKGAYNGKRKWIFETKYINCQCHVYDISALCSCMLPVHTVSHFPFHTT